MGDAKMAGQPIGRSKAETLNELTPDVLLDRIDGLQTQVATAETEAETARTAAREATQAAEVLRKTGGEAELRARGLWRVSGEHGGGSDDIRPWWHDCGRRDGGVKGMTTPRAILVGDM
jgi:hypothetical protein